MRKLYENNTFQQLQEEKPRGDNKTIIFLIDQDWVNKWLKFVQNDIKHVETPGPIQNSDLEEKLVLNNNKLNL